MAATLLAAASSCARRPPADSMYFGQPPPGEVPAIFAPDVISVEGRFEQFLTYSVDGRVITFGVTNADWSDFTLMQIVLEDGAWTEPRAVPFLGSGGQGLTAAADRAESRVFFAAPRHGREWPSDIWTNVRGDAGWADPVRVEAPVSSDGNEFEVTVAGNGTLYFSSDREGGLGDLDLYRAPRVDGAYPRVENLGPRVNTASGDDLPYIAPDESYMVFASDRPGGLGFRDLYVTFRLDDGWSEPRNLGAPINSEAWEIYPWVSADGRYLFFTRRTEWHATEDSDIYWVSAAILDRLR